MKVLLTGATGFIGSSVARQLVASGHEVTALVRPGSDTWRISDLLSSISLLRCDILSSADLAAGIESVRPDLCVHLAWYAEPGKYLRSPDNARYMSASMELATKLAARECHRFVGIGTCYEYDFSGVTRPISERDATRPMSPYAVSKLGLYSALSRLGRDSGIEVAWARLFQQYGPMEDPRRLVPYVIRALLANAVAKTTSGDQVRDYLHVDDVAGAICAVAESDVTGPVNVGSGNGTTVRELVSMIGKLLGRERLIQLGSIPYDPSEPMFVCADNSLLKQRTSWSPRYDLRAGIGSTIEWWRNAKPSSHGAGGTA